MVTTRSIPGLPAKSTIEVDEDGGDPARPAGARTAEIGVVLPGTEMNLGDREAATIAGLPAAMQLA